MHCDQPSSEKHDLVAELAGPGHKHNWNLLQHTRHARANPDVIDLGSRPIHPGMSWWISRSPARSRRCCRRVGQALVEKLFGAVSLERGLAAPVSLFRADRSYVRLNYPQSSHTPVSGNSMLHVEQRPAF